MSKQLVNSNHYVNDRIILQSDQSIDDELCDELVELRESIQNTHMIAVNIFYERLFV